MKYARLGPQKGILHISDTPFTEAQQPSGLGSTVELTDEQAATVLAGRASTPKIIYFLIDGELKTLAQKIEAEKRALPAPVRRQTKLNIMRKLVELGKWEQFKAMLDSMPTLVHDAWDLTQEISSADPMFVENRSAIIAGLGITSEQLDGLFLP